MLTTSRPGVRAHGGMLQAQFHNTFPKHYAVEKDTRTNSRIRKLPNGNRKQYHKRIRNLRLWTMLIPGKALSTTLSRSTQSYSY